MPSSFITAETRAGEPVLASGFTIIPIVRSLHIHPSGLPGGLRWNRPSAVAIQARDGPQRMQPVRDVSRQAQLALLGAGLAGSLIIWLAFRRKSYG